MRNMFLVLGLVFSLVAQAQMYFTTLGSEPAYCRLFGYQSGNGIVYAAVDGGQAPYTYLWEQLGTSNNSNTTTWGGRNPGTYKITVTDGNAATIIDTVEVDSINPVANFTALGNSLSGGGVLYYGSAPVDVTFENLSTGVTNFNDPNADTNFYWQFTQFDNWNIISTYYDQYYTYNYAGNWGVTLVAQNKNGCADTAYVQIFLDGPAGITDLANEEFKVYRKGENLAVSCKYNSDQKQLKIYDLSGKMIKNQLFSGKNTSFLWNFGSGTFVYECIDPVSNERLGTGKFIF